MKNLIWHPQHETMRFLAALGMTSWRCVMTSWVRVRHLGCVCGILTAQLMCVMRMGWDISVNCHCPDGLPPAVSLHRKVEHTPALVVWRFWSHVPLRPERGQRYA